MKSTHKIFTAFFLIPDYKNLYDDGLVYLAEGLLELGVTIFANRDYWKPNINQEYLFNYLKDFDPSSADVVIISNNWPQFIDPISFKEFKIQIPNWLFAKERLFRTVYIDNMDGYNTFSYTSEARKFDFILRCKKNKNTFNYENIFPWVLGYQNRILTEKLKIPTEDKKFEIAVNFNFSHGYEHQLRKFAKTNIIEQMPPKLINYKISNGERPKGSFSSLMWDQTFKKHNPDYFNNLEKSLIVATFCGDMIPGMPQNPAPYMLGGNKAKIKKIFYKGLSYINGKEDRIIQWDSWRFWETLALGSVPLHIDLEKYGVELPVMPKNWEHYIGVDLNNIKTDVERILDDKKTVYSIAKKGEAWVIDNYSPLASAQRFIKLISQ